MTEQDTLTMASLQGSATWEWGFAENRLALSEQMATLMGLSPERAARLDFDEFVRHIHPEDRRDLRNAVLRAYRRGEPCEEFFRLIRPDNTVVLVRSRGRIIPAEDGSPRSLLSSVSVVQDSTHGAEDDQDYLLRLVYNGLPEGFVITDLAGNIRQVNATYCEILDQKEPVLLEHSLIDLRSGQSEADVRAFLRQVVEQGQAEGRLRQRNRHDDTLELLFRGHLGDHEGRQFLYFFVTDVTERTLGRDELKRENRRLQLLLDSAGEGIYAVNKYGNCTFVNRAAQELLGYGRQQLLGRNVFELIHGRDEDGRPQANDPIGQVLSTGKPQKVEDILVWRRDGRSFHAEYAIYPLVQEGRLVGAICVFRDITRQRSLALQLEYQSSHDTLTGLINRSELLIRINRALGSARHEGRTHALLFLDLDQFKVINDNSGHAAGDELLRSLATRFRQEIRRGDSLARLGGDEFGILLLNCDLEYAERIAAKFRDLVNSCRFEWEGEKYKLGVSIGVVPITPDSRSASAILSAGDTACYSAKDAGQNQIKIYRPDDTGFLRRRGDMLWLGRINEAINEDRFRLFYQEIRPLQDSDEGLSFEVLVKMLDEDDRLIEPGEFLPAAERASMTPQIDRWVIRHVFDWMERQGGERLKRLGHISINLSGHSLSERDFLDFVVHEFDQRGLPQGKLCFEVTETVAIANLINAQHIFSRLAEMGCLFSLDDFGTGMSSYGYLKNLPVDFVKIDGVFVRTLTEDNIDAKLVESITDIAHEMGIRSIAEYVENAQIMERLKAIGVDYAQGYFIGEPRPLDSLRLD